MQKNKDKKIFYGADVVWTSSKPDVINASSGEVVVDSDAVVSVTLTANFTYTNALEQTASADEPVSFTVIVRDPDSMVKDERIPLTNYAFSRSSDPNREDEKDYAYGYYSVEDTGIDTIRTGSSFTAYGQFNLSGYEEILRNSSTTISAQFEAGYQYSSAKIYDLKAVLTPDKSDVYNQDSVTYNIAQALGLHETEGRPLLFIKSDGTSVASGTAAVFETNKDALLGTLDEGTDNSIVSIHIVGITQDENSNIRANSTKTGLFISYDKTEIDNAAYLTDVKNALTWNVISEGAQDKVSADLCLPTKFKGASIEWESDDTAISSDGKVDFDANKGKTVTLTANMSYTNILGDTVTDVKTFTVTLSDGEYYEIGTPSLEIDGDEFKASWSVENYTGTDVTYYVYLAAYCDKELVGLTPVEYIAENGKPTDIAPTVAYENGYTAKLIILEGDHITPLRAAIEK